MPLSVLADAAGAEAQGGSMWVMLIQLLPIVLIFVVMYFLLIRPQKKKEKQAQEMRNNLQVGDEVITAGGIIGRVVSVREDTVVVETGGDRSKVRIKRWAIQSVETIHDDTEA
ncbi:preprotein translocase subunit YajC [Clostridiaceae bacterium NSJ-33]|uniref:Preprotein translocase subunit YajC n=2 Tax=Fumia xinanensis TaxID=2763659 RepID=A0A926I2X0_9FIRM|nr:preprotein translocase subunit YajC [Fumia xinanensis]PWL41770.1 MAG: preprotein translocase subunit YajC [Clostridiales bacterium]